MESPIRTRSTSEAKDHQLRAWVTVVVDTYSFLLREIHVHADNFDLEKAAVREREHEAAPSAIGLERAGERRVLAARALGVSFIHQ